MIKVLEIVAGSWPIAMIIVAFMIACVIIYLIRWFKQSDIEDKAFKANQAIVVRRNEE